MLKNKPISRRQFLTHMGQISLVLATGCQTTNNDKVATLDSKIITLPDKPITFAQITDTHVGYQAVNEKVLEEIVEQLEQHKPNFVIHTGDVAHFNCVPEWQLFNKIFQSLTIPLYTIPGNHDLGKYPTAKNNQSWEKYMGVDRFSFVHSQAAFIGANLTSLWLPDWDNEKQRQQQREKIYQWLEEQLSQSQNCKARFIFGHFPIYLMGLMDSYYKGSIAEYSTRKRLLEILEKGNVTAYFCGHTHCAWQNELETDQGKKIPQMAVSALSYPALVRGLVHPSLKHPGQLGWNLWKYYDSGLLEYQFVAISNKVKTRIFSPY